MPRAIFVSLDPAKHPVGRWAWAVAFVAVVAATGCRDATQASKKTEAAESTATKKPAVEMLELGAEPRARLLWKPALATRDLTVSLRSDLSGPELGSVAMPGLTFRGTISSVPPDPTSSPTSVVVEHSVTRVEIDRDTPNARLAVDLAAEVDAAVGHTTRLRYDANRRLVSRETTKPARVVGPLHHGLVQLGELFGTLQVPLPQAEVGVGARWSVESVVEQDGLPLRQRATFTLREREASRVRVGIELEQSLEPDAARGAQPIESLTAHGVAEVEFDLQEVGPRHAELTTNASIVSKGERPSAGKVELSLRAVVDGTGD